MENHCCPYQDCSKAYKSKSNLNQHIQAIHSETKKFQCEVCFKILSSGQNLKEHKLLHSKILPFVCKEIGCGRRFRHGSQFSAHKKIHHFIEKALNSVAPFNAQGVLNNLFAEGHSYVKKETEILPNEVFELPAIKGKQEFKLPIL